MVGFNFGGSGRQERSTTERDTFLSALQSPFLANMFGGANALANLLTPGALSSSSALSGNLLGQGQQLLGSLRNISEGRFGQGLAETIAQLSGFQGAPGSAAAGIPGMGPSAVGGLDLGGMLAGTGALQNISTSDALSSILMQENPALQGSLDVLGQNIQENLRASLGQIGGQAGLAGARGGARQALASGQAAGDASRAFATEAGRLVSQDFAARQALAPALLQADQQAQLAAALGQQQGDLALRGLQLDQGRLMDAFGIADQELALAQAGLIDQAAQFGSGQQLDALTQAGALQLGATDQQSRAALGALPQLQNLFGIGMAPFTAAFAPLQQMAQILGNPIILERLRSMSEAEESSIEFGLSLGG